MSWSRDLPIPELANVLIYQKTKKEKKFFSTFLDGSIDLPTPELANLLTHLDGLAYGDEKRTSSGWTHLQNFQDPERTEIDALLVAHQLGSATGAAPVTLPSTAPGGSPGTQGAEV